MEIYGRLGNVLNEAEPLLRALVDEEEKKSHLRSLGTMMQDVWIQLMLPIVREHPGARSRQEHVRAVKRSSPREGVR